MQAVGSFRGSTFDITGIDDGDFDGGPPAGNSIYSFVSSDTREVSNSCHDYVTTMSQKRF